MSDDDVCLANNSEEASSPGNNSRKLVAVQKKEFLHKIQIAAETKMGPCRGVAGAFVVLLLSAAQAPPSAEAQYLPQQYTSQSMCQCPPGYRPVYGDATGTGGGSKIFKATLILEECPPCPTGYSNAVQPSFGYNSQQGLNSNYLTPYGQQQPSLLTNQGPYGTNQQPFDQYSLYGGGGVPQQQQPFGSQGGQFGQGFNPATSGQFGQSGGNGGFNQPYGAGGNQPGAFTPNAPFPQANQPFGQQGYPQSSSPNFQSGQPGGAGQNFQYPGSGPLQSGFGNQPPLSASQPGYPQQQFGFQGQQPNLLSPTGFQPPYFAGAGTGAEGAGSPNQPGYLPNFRGDRFTNPQRIQETRALNEPFYAANGGEPHYPGGVQDIIIPSQQPGGQPNLSPYGRPYETEKAVVAEAAKEKAKERRLRRRKR
ncbi:hypothetical protein DdX_01803 [Ditylenchus destructor]|uniref:Uncharacterized protein n=1 Tax=Ditylenchus destructor TaxID=166010 RepID=A0AAD4NIR7_9BILA|nr:hypothetical protein DdX_01803 [Ditylenchus destructor]